MALLTKKTLLTEKTNHFLSAIDRVWASEPLVTCFPDAMKSLEAGKWQERYWDYFDKLENATLDESLSLESFREMVSAWESGFRSGLQRYQAILQKREQVKADLERRMRMKAKAEAIKNASPILSTHSHPKQAHIHFDGSARMPADQTEGA